MILIDAAALLIFVFLSVYVLMQLFIISCSSKGRIADIEKRSYATRYEQNITVIIYSHNDSATIMELIESLRKQNYNQEKYSINVILDNCDDNSAKLLEILGGTRLWRINTDIKPIGKYKAIAWLLERILTSENTNAFVFLDADCTVKQDFLSKLNGIIADNPVIIGESLSIEQNPEFFASLVSFKNKLKNRVSDHGRYYASLGNILDSPIFAIRQDVLEKISYNIADKGFEEYEYSFRLANAGIPILFSSQLVCHKKLNENFNRLVFERQKARYKNLITFKNRLLILFSKRNIPSKELLLSLIYPSDEVFIVLLLILSAVCANSHSLFSGFIGIKPVGLLFFGYLLIKFSAMVVSRCTFSEYKNGIFWLFISPAVFLASIATRVKLNLSLKFRLPDKIFINRHEAKKIIETTVSDGKKELPCKLEIKQAENNCQAIFIFNEKKMVSGKYHRVDQAVEEILDKLRSHGFTLKVCLNCGYFKLNENLINKLDGEQGYCLFDNVNKSSKAYEYSYVWNSCPNIISINTRKYIEEKLNEAKTN